MTTRPAVTAGRGTGAVQPSSAGIAPAAQAARRRGGAWSVSSFYRWLAVPPALGLAVFFVWPILAVIWRGFSDPELGIGNYVKIWQGGPYLQVLWITIKTATIVTVLSLLTAYPVAYVISNARGRVLHLMAAMIIIPLWTSVVIRSYAWMVIFQRRGVLNEVLVSTGIFEKPVSFLPGSLSVHVGMVHIMLPFMLLPLLANMRSIDRSLLTAASVMGANPFRSFVAVFLPLSLPGVVGGSTLVFMMSLGFYITPALLGGPEHMMAAVIIEQQANQLLNWGLASALATILLLITLAIYLVHIRLTDRVQGRATGGF